MRIAAATVLSLLAVIACRAGPSSSPPPEAEPPASESTQTLQVGSAAPPFSLQAHDGSTFSLAEALAEGPVVVVFYRGHW